MGSSPCSHEHDAPNTLDASGLKGSELPIVALDKNDLTLWQGQTPGNNVHLHDDHFLKITRASVKGEEGDQGDQ